MAQSWFYQHEGKTRGPVSSEEIKALAEKGLLGPQDLLWPEGGKIEEGIPASAAMDFTNLSAPLPETPPPVTDSMPDWLGDVAAQETKGPAAVPSIPLENPNWLEDLRVWIALDVYAASRQPQEEPVVLEAVEAVPPEEEFIMGGVDEVPDWLEGWLTPEKPVLKPISPPPAPPPAKPAAPIPTAIPVSPPRKVEPPPPPLAQPVSPAQPAVPVPEPLPPKKQTGVASPASKTEIPRPVPGKPVTIPSVEALAEKTREETGFDLQTGQIVDAVKFQKWKQQQARSRATNQPAMTNASMFEVFREARTALERWVDEEKNRLRILHGEIHEIKNNKEIQALFRQYAGHGFTQKLEKHLEFMVENRRKYYRAGGQ